MVFDIIIFSFAIIYALLIIRLIAGWKRQSYFKPGKYQPDTKISIIIPARNEEDNIGFCLEAIHDQHYPEDLFEVIVVDDHSSDGTSFRVFDFIRRKRATNFSLISLSSVQDGGFGKKAALAAGINASKNEVILTTDADCTMGSDWLKTIGTFFHLHKPAMLVMPVVIAGKQRFFQKLQSLEFMSIAGVTGATAGWGHHIMCNGANLAFTKNAFEKVDGYAGNMQYASGDDVFLLHKIKKAFGQKICFLKSTDAIVSSKPLPGVSSFFNQRTRWFSKNRAYKDKATIITAAIAGIFNMLLAFSPLCLFFAGCKFWYLAWILKIVVDFPFLMIISSFFRKQKLMWLYLPASLLYPYYVLFTCILGIGGRFSWKGRRYYQYEKLPDV